MLITRTLFCVILHESKVPLMRTPVMYPPSPEFCDSTRFLYKTARERLARLAGRDELDRHVPLERFVVGKVDIAHSARADETAEAIPPESDVSGLYVHLRNRRRHYIRPAGRAMEQRGVRPAPLSLPVGT